MLQSGGKTSKGIAQKEKTFAAPDAHQGAPARLLRRKEMSGYQARALNGGIAASHLRGQRQKQIIQPLLGKEIAHQQRPALQQNDLALASAGGCLQDGAGAERASLSGDNHLRGRWQWLPAEPRRSAGRRDNQR